MTTRMNLNVDNDIPELLAELAGGERKKGPYLTQLIRSIHAGQLDTTQGSELEILRNAVAHLSGSVKIMDSRMQRMEMQLAAVMAKTT